MKILGHRKKFRTGTQNQKIRDLGTGPGLKIEKSGIEDWDRDSDSRDEEFRDSTLGDCFNRLIIIITFIICFMSICD